VSSGLSRRGMLLGAVGLAAGAIVAAGCGSARSVGSARPRLKAGTPLWRTTLPGGLAGAAEAAGTLCVVAGDGVHGLSVRTGKKSWSLRDRYDGVTGIGDKVLIAGAASGVAALDPASGQPRWRFDLPDLGTLPNSPLLSQDSTTIYVSGLSAATGRLQSAIFAIDAVTGEHKWAAYFTASVGSMTAGSGVVCAGIGVNPTKLVALDARTGARKWTAGPPIASADDISDGVIYASGTASKSSVLALDVPAGNVRWTADVGGDLWYTESDAGMMYANTYAGSAQDGGPGDLIALDARTGKTMWKRHYPEGPPEYLEPAGEVVYTGTDSGMVRALDAATGRVLWSHEVTDTAADTLMAMVLAPGTLCLVNADGAIATLET